MQTAIKLVFCSDLAVRKHMPIQYKEIFLVEKNENFYCMNFDIFLFFAQNIDCGHMLEPPVTG